MSETDREESEGDNSSGKQRLSFFVFLKKMFGSNSETDSDETKNSKEFRLPHPHNNFL